MSTKAKPTASSEKAIADAIIAHLKHIKTVGPHWYVYRDGVWREGRRDIYRPLAYKLSDPNQWKAHLESASLAQVEGRQQCDGSAFRGAIMLTDDGSVAINVRNGIVMVQPDRIWLAQHNHEFYFTRALAVDHDAAAVCPLYRATFDQSLPDHDDRTLQKRCYGNFLWPDARHEIVLIDIGETGCGKSTLAEPIMALLDGGEGGLLTSLSLGQICDPNCYALAKLRYSMVNLGTELQSLALDESENFKKIISGEPFEARPIYSPPFTMTNFPKLWFLANSIPRFKHGTEAELRRTRFVIFGVKPPTPDKSLKSRLRDEVPGVFNFMLEGLQELMREGNIPLGGTKSQAIRDRFRVSNDPIKAFVDELCELSPAGCTSKETVGNAYTEFCDSHSLPFKADAGFFQRLYNRFPEVRDSKLRGSDGKRVPSVAGLLVKQAASPSNTSIAS